MPKNEASKRSGRSRMLRAPTYFVPSLSTRESKRVMQSLPAIRFAQNSSGESAPGKRPDMPITAMASGGGSSSFIGGDGSWPGRHVGAAHDLEQGKSKWPLGERGKRREPWRWGWQTNR